MKEILNAFRGIKEPMHVIMEEDEIYEQSFIGNPAPLNENDDYIEENSINGQSESSMMKPESLNDSNISTPVNPDKMNGLMTEMMETMEESNSKGEKGLIEYVEPDQKDGHVLFSILRNEILKAFGLKSASKADSYLNKVTFIARKMVNIWFGKQTTLENFNTFIDLLKEKAYLISFPIMLEAFRKMSCFEIDPNGYVPFCELIQACLTEVGFSHQVSSKEERHYTFDLAQYRFDLLHQR